MWLKVFATFEPCGVAPNRHCMGCSLCRIKCLCITADTLAFPVCKLCHASQGMHPSRALSTLYNSMYMLGVFTLFFGGPLLWPNKRRRMLTGYSLYVFALAVPPLVSHDRSTLTRHGGLTCRVSDSGLAAAKRSRRARSSMPSSSKGWAALPLSPVPYRSGTVGLCSHDGVLYLVLSVRTDVCSAGRHTGETHITHRYQPSRRDVNLGCWRSYCWRGRCSHQLSHLCGSLSTGRSLHTCRYGLPGWASLAQ
jgi:hypothetical protein